MATINKHADILKLIPVQESSGTVLSERDRTAVLTRAAIDIAVGTFYPFRKIFYAWDGYEKAVNVALKKKFLERVTVFGLCGEENKTAMQMEIDWNKHEFLITDDNAFCFHYSPDKPFKDQVDAAIGQLLDFFAYQVSKNRVDSFSPILTWTPCGTDEHKNRMTATGAKIIDEETYGKQNEFLKDSTLIRFASSRMKEMAVGVWIPTTTKVRSKK